jgi:hypothetical protein
MNTPITNAFSGSVLRSFDECGNSLDADASAASLTGGI